MDLKLTRSAFESYGVFGLLSNQVANEPVCMTLEHAFPQPGGRYLPAVPSGTYTCQRRYSPEFGYDVFQIMDVPGHTYIEIHIGNFNSDTQGCICVGQSRIDKMITLSRLTFAKFMGLQNGVNQFTLIVE